MSRVDQRVHRTLTELDRDGQEVCLLSIGIGGRQAATFATRHLQVSDWQALLVDPEPELFTRFTACGATRPQVRCEQVAITSTDGETDLLAIPPSAYAGGSVDPKLAGLASLVPVLAAETSTSFRRLRDEWGRLSRVPTSTLSSLIRRHKVTRVDVLLVDAGGYEWPIFAQFDLGHFAPALVRIAWSFTPAAERVRMVRRLERHGYAVESLRGELLAFAPWTDVATPAVPTGPDGDVVVYAITYNAPGQLERWLTSLAAGAPDILNLPRKFLLDNSTRPDTTAAYDQLAAQYGFTILRHGNLGISGGRYFCAQHFEQLEGAWAMIWFEDDMLLAPPIPAVCRNGLTSYVPSLLARAISVVLKERLDYLKLSFTEFFGDHHLNWAWYNVPGPVRRREFPDGTYHTRISHTGVEDGVSYVVGEVHYSNWPTLMTRRGNAQLFLAKPEPLHEQHYMADAFLLMRGGTLRAGVLLASPIQHDRTHHYAADDRKEF